ncbi:diguanylate cyclase [Pararobbsia alpina]|uniref:putative bifunctional diguanylate cyclase/phosphodiesterase n=1 Tax=Pararobbsia alpina TaxID=621374 RepID=UPI0039A78290
MFMRAHSLRTRIALVFVVLLLAIQLAVFVVITGVIHTSSRTTVNQQLDVGQRVFERTLRNNSDKLIDSAKVIAADFGFRAAVASDDVNTVRSALENHGERVHAGVVEFIGLDGKLVAQTHPPSHTFEGLVFPKLVSRAARDGSASAIDMIDGRVYEMVAVPVKAPLTIGWVVMGFNITDVMLREQASLVGLDVSFLGLGGDNRWQMLATSIMGAEPDALTRLLSRTARSPGLPTVVSVNGEDYGTKALVIATDGRPIVAVLQRSMHDALAPLRHLQSTLVVIALVGVAISVAGGMFTARSIAEPIRDLTRFARQIGGGDYHAEAPVARHGEVGELADAFERMRHDIAIRERQISLLAYEDTLTGLPNRGKFNTSVEAALAEARVQGHPMSIMMMDLDRFKYVNDSLGHHIGDLLLREVAFRFWKVLANDGDVIARLGGDEFAALLPFDGLDVGQRKATALLHALETPIVIEGQIIDVSVSIGLVSFPHDGDTFYTLMRRADVAMYAAKRRNAGYAVYHPGDDQHNPERLSLMGELRQAVERDELTLYYQPKVDLTSGRVSYVEALLRWEHPVRGIVPPDQFIPFAEQTGYIKVLSRWVANKALEQCAAWRKAGIELDVSINVSARDLINADLPQTFATLLEKHRVEPEWIWVEITESAVMDDPVHAMSTLDDLYAMGLRLSIDDFGTGYSSLAYLKKMPVHEIKIDKSFVMGMTDDRDDETIVRSTIALGHSLGLKVVAEGVETQSALEQLRQLDCDLAQGYFVSRPLSPERLQVWLTEWRAGHSKTPAGADLPV